MPDIVLSASAGSDVGDAAVRGMLGVFAAAFPGRIRSCYAEGSYADGTAVATSDLDLTIVFKESFADDAERAIAARLVRDYAASSPVELDVELADDAQLAGGVYPSLKDGSLCLYGEDHRTELPLIPLDEWTRQRMHAAFRLLVVVFDRPHVVAYPLAYPAATDAFYGYARRMVCLPSGMKVPSTRDLVRVTGWIATALLAHRAGVYVARKSACHHAYRCHIGDEWTRLLEDIYCRCRTSWDYLVPPGEAGRRELRALCARTLQFENHFLAIYRDYLLTQLRGDNRDTLRRALWVLEQTTLCDDRVREAVAVAAQHDDLDVRHAAERTRELFRAC